MSQRWFESQRIAWIAEMLHIYGFINREHLMKKFGISRPQASKDLRAYERHSSGALRYNLSAKRYEAVSWPEAERNREAAMKLKRANARKKAWATRRTMFPASEAANAVAGDSESARTLKRVSS